MSKQTTQKREYKKPAVLKLELAAEEVMAVGCKLAGGGSAPLGSPCTASACAQAGS